jgi:hypothetical protein
MAAAVATVVVVAAVTAAAAAAVVVKVAVVATAVAAAATEFRPPPKKDPARVLFSWFFLGCGTLSEPDFYANNKKVAAGRPLTKIAVICRIRTRRHELIAFLGLHRLFLVFQESPHGQ